MATTLYTTASTGETWTAWTKYDTYDTTSMTDSMTTCAVWKTWTVTASSSTSITVGNPWQEWLNYKEVCEYDGAPLPVPEPWVDTRTPEQIHAANERVRLEREAIKAKADKAAEERRLVVAKARALLDSMLTVQQREQLQRERFFEVVGQSSGKRYRIRHGTHGNVRLLAKDGKREVQRYCAQPSGVPDEDAMLAQKLMIETDEAAWLKVANASPA